MRLGVLFSGGKDSCYAAYLAKKQEHEIVCLISIFSENPESFMFHTPNIHLVEKQAEVMNLPIIIEKTKGEKELELKDLEKAIKRAKEEYQLEGIATGAIKSNYQKARIMEICSKLNLQCFNLLWHKDEFEYLNELIRDDFKVIIVGVFAYPLDKSWLGREINYKFLNDVRKLNEKYQIHVAGEGGEFETFVLNCPLFKKPLKVIDRKISGSGNSWTMEIEVE